jgi:Arc/MetJ family transcription regulator
VSEQNVEIDDDLVALVMRRHGFASQAEAVDAALRRLAARGAAPVAGHPAPLSREQALAMRGSGWAVKPAGPRLGEGPASS